jgi:hypothetical protein
MNIPPLSLPTPIKWARCSHSRKCGAVLKEDDMMYFAIPVPSWKTARRALDRFEARGWACFRGSDGKQVALVHASMIRAGFKVPPCSRLICCYPGKVRQERPDLAHKIVGDWPFTSWANALYVGLRPNMVVGAKRFSLERWRRSQGY